MGLQADVSRRGSVSIVSLSGNITVGEGDVLLRRRVQELVDAGRKRVLLDLSGVRYMDSAGLGELIASHQQLRDSGGGVKLVQPSPRVLSMLQVIGLDRVFETFDALDAAVRSFGPHEDD